MKDSRNKVSVRKTGLVLLMLLSSLTLMGGAANPESESPVASAPKPVSLANAVPDSGEDTDGLRIMNTLDPTVGAPELSIVSVEFENRDSGEIQTVDLEGEPILIGETFEACCIDAGSYNVLMRTHDGKAHAFDYLQVTRTDACDVIVQLKWTEKIGTHAVASDCSGRHAPRS